MRIFIYSRKSVFTGKGESIENQVEMCRQYIQNRIEGSRDAEISVYEDEGFSGRNLDRPQFQKMLADSRRQKPDYIVCYRLDRISRSVGDFAPLVEDLIGRDIGFICIKEQFDTSTPMGKAMMYIASVFAQLERETIAERVRDNMLLLARTGRWLGGSPPTGYRSERVEEYIIDGKVKTSFKLKTDPVEIRTVKTIFQKYLELRSLSGVSRYLMQAGLSNRSGEPYSLPGIKDILRNPVYCIADQQARAYFIDCESDVCFVEEQCSDQYGLLSYNKRSTMKKGSSRLDKSQWIIAIGRHRGIVSGADWVKVQRLLAENSEKNPVKSPQSFNEYSILSGQIFCSKCGARMYAKRRSNSSTLFDYICGGKLKNGKRCDCQNLSGQQADQFVCDCVLGCVREDDSIYQLLDILKRKIEGQIPTDRTAYYDVQIDKLQREIEGLVATLASVSGKSVIRHISERMEELDAELDTLRVSRENEDKARKSADGQNHEQVSTLSDKLTSIQQCFSEMTIHEKRDFIRLFVERIEWDGKDLHIFMYGE